MNLVERYLLGSGAASLDWRIRWHTLSTQRVFDGSAGAGFRRAVRIRDWPVVALSWMHYRRRPVGRAASLDDCYFCAQCDHRINAGYVAAPAHRLPVKQRRKTIRARLRCGRVGSVGGDVIRRAGQACASQAAAPGGTDKKNHRNRRLHDQQCGLESFRPTRRLANPPFLRNPAMSVRDGRTGRATSVNDSCHNGQRQ